MNESKITISLPCDLQQEEYETKSHDLAGLCQEINAKKAAASFAAKQAKEEIEKMEERRQRLAEIVRSKQEYRSVECVERFDYVDRLARTVRLDTGETVKTRAMELHEYQEQMDLHATPISDKAVPFSKSGT